VVFVPMLFEEEARNPVPEGSLAIPPRPDMAEETSPDLSEPPEEPGPLPPELPPPALLEEAPTLDAELPPPEETGPAAESSEQIPEPVAQELPPEPPPPARAPAPGNLSSWVIQVAALTELPRARGLERELRAKGFPAFIEQAQVKGKTYFRVRLGPEADRKRIETMASALQDKTGQKGQILRYP
jgi:DedD protein